jgi:hypothetical protein
VPFCAYEFSGERPEVVGSKLASLSAGFLNTWTPQYWKQPRSMNSVRTCFKSILP